jgi:hypothetical protein
VINTINTHTHTPIRAAQGQAAPSTPPPISAPKCAPARDTHTGTRAKACVRSYGVPARAGESDARLARLNFTKRARQIGAPQLKQTIVNMMNAAGPSGGDQSAVEAPAQQKPKKPFVSRKEKSLGLMCHQWVDCVRLCAQDSQIPNMRRARVAYGGRSAH